MPDLGPILAVTVVVADLDLARRAYRRLLGHAVIASGSSDGSRWCLLGPPDAGWGMVRLVERAGAERPPVFRTLGWAALEILVADADAAHRRCLEVAGFEVLQPPSSVGGSGALRALQARGPGGEGVYLTEIVRPSERFDLPTLESGEHRVYVVVAGTHGVDGVCELLGGRFDAPRVSDHGLPVRVLNQAYRLPPATLHRVSAVQLAGSTLVEIDEYPPGAAPRSPEAGGIRSVTLAGRRPPVAAGLRLGDRPEPPYDGRPAYRLSLGPGLEAEVVERAGPAVQ